MPAIFDYSFGTKMITFFQRWARATVLADGQKWGGAAATALPMFGGGGGGS